MTRAMTMTMTQNDGLNAWRKLGYLAAVCLVVALGNMRARESVAAAASGAIVDAQQGASAVASTTAAFESREAVDVGADEDGLSDAADARTDSNDVGLVPAVYARDPDVRFVYFRQVSKWM